MANNENEQQRYPQSILAACLLPWTTTNELDEAQFESHIQEVIGRGYKSLYVMGTAGEGYAVSDSLFQQVVKIFASQTVSRGLDPQVGIVALSMKQIIERITLSRELGFEMFQISLPSWGALDEIETLQFFKTVCGTFPDCRFLHYNLPRAKRLVSGMEYRRISSEVPNLVATKNSSGDYVRTSELMNHAPHLQHFFVGNFSMGCTMGRCSLISSYSLLFPSLTWQLFDAGVKQNFEVVFGITNFLTKVRSDLFGHCHRAMIDGSYDKTLVRLRNPNFPNRLLPPYYGLTEEEFAICRKVYQDRYQHIE